MIKIIHIITGGLHREGITSTQMEFFKKMDLKKFKIYVAAVHDNDPEMIRELEKIGCIVLQFPDRRENLLKYFIALVNSLRKIKPDIVHVHGSSALMSIELLAAKIANVKNRIAHSRNTKADHATIDTLLRPIFNLLYTYAMACGIDAGKWLFKNKKFTVIHNGKDFKKFYYNKEIRDRFRIENELSGKIVVGHVGRMNYQKNHEYLIKVFHEFQKEHDNALLYLIGDGALRENISAQISSLGIQDKVVFAGNVNDVHLRIQAMDIMVFPYRFEGLPNVVLEWQAEGLPCLISDKITRECASSDFVEFASIEDNPEVWADKMQQMLTKFNVREEQATKGIQALQENGFDIVDATRKLEQIYLNLAK